jgi:hypothetical protein
VEIIMETFPNNTITYGTLTFSNAGSVDCEPDFPVPFISKQVEYIVPRGLPPKLSGRWCRKENITLNGTLSDCSNCGGLTLEEKRNTIITAFSEDFHTLEIDGLDNIPLIKVISVDVGPQTAPSPIVSYSIQLEAYPDDSFALAYRVLNPQDSVEITENDDATATITHSVSCQGLNTAAGGSVNNALSNAKVFVEEKIAGGCLKGNLILSKDPAWKKHLVSVSEDIDRITASYQMTKTYTTDLTRIEGGDIVVRHTKTVDESWGSNKRTTHSGKIDAGRLESAPGEDLDRIRAAYVELKGTFEDPPAVEPFIITEQVEEDTVNNSLSFTIVLENARPEVIDDYSITVSEDSDGSLIKVSIQGTISATGPAACRLKKVRKYFCGTETCKPSARNINGRYKTLCGKAYAEYLAENEITTLPANVVFCDDALGINVTEDRGMATIQYSMQFDNRITYGHHQVSHTMTFIPSVQHIVQKELNRPTTRALDEEGNASFDLLWMGVRNRASFGIQGSISVYDPAGTPMESIAESKFFKYCSFIDDLLTQKTESADRDDSASFNYQWGFHTPARMVNSYPATAEIVTLKLK